MKNNRRIKAQLVFSIIAFLCCTSVVCGAKVSQNGSNLNNQAAQPIPASHVATPPRSQEVPIPADGDCLYKSIMVAYLLPVVDDIDLFNARLAMLIGENTIIPTEETKSDKGDENKDDNKDDSKMDINQVWDAVQIRQHFLNLRRATFVYCLRRYPFPALVPYMKAHIGIKKNKVDQDKSKEWGGPQEIQTIANRLQITIEEYTPNPDDNNKSLTELICIQPKQKKDSRTTLRIVRDNPTKEEAVDKSKDLQTQLIQYQSVQDAQHRQHYRALLNKTAIYHLQGKFDQPKVKPGNKVFDPFPKLAPYMKSHIGIKKNTVNEDKSKEWGAPQEIQTIANGLQITIEECTPNPDDNNKSLTEPICIQPKQKKYSRPTLRIVRDNPTKEEAVDKSQDWQTQLMKDQSVQDAQHRQHYRALLDKIGVQHLQGQSGSSGEFDDKLVDSVYIEVKDFDTLRIQEHAFKGIPNLNNNEALLEKDDKGNDKDRRKCLKELALSPTIKVATRYIVQLYITFGDERGVGTGTIIGIRDGRFFILTAAHNVETHHEVHGKIQASPVYFTLVGEQRKYPCSNYFIYPTYDAENKQGKDIALIVSVICNIPSLTIFPTPRHIENGNYKKGYAIGYPGEKKRGELWGMEGEVIVGQRKVTYKIDTTSGQSGSPIFCLVNNMAYIVGVHKDGGFGYNYGEKITPKVLEWIKSPSSFPTADDSKNNLHLPFDEFDLEDRHLIDRGSEVKRIKEAFGAFPAAINKKSKMVILTAWGGAGKTILSELYANHTWQKPYQQIWRIHMESEETCNNSINEIIYGLDISQDVETSDTKRYCALKKILKRYPKWLLILDNTKGPKDIQKLSSIRGGHILVTARSSEEDWQVIYNRSKHIHVDTLKPQESLDLFFSFHQPLTDKALTLAQKLGHLPLALAQAGHYIQAQKDQLGSDPYAKYLEKYLAQSKMIDLDEKKKKKIKAINPNFETVYNTFSVTIEKIGEEKQYETLRILRVMAYFNPDGVSILFFKHLRPSRKGLINKAKVLFQSPYTTVDDEAANEGWEILRKYGLVGQDQQKFKTHRLIQEIMRSTMEGKMNIKKQAVQLLETMYHFQKQGIEQNKASKKKQSRKELDKNLFTLATQLNMLSHLYHMMGYIGEDVALRKRLLALMNRLEQTDALVNGCYLPPQDTNDQDLHTQVEAFVYKSKKPLMLITGDAGAGKSAYGAHLLQKTWKKYHASWGWTSYKYIPLFISLPEVCTDDGPAKLHKTFDLVAHALARKGLSKEVIKNLWESVKAKKEHLLLILDSFDEVSVSINASTTNVCDKYELDKWISPSTKIVITCRSAYLNDKNKLVLFGCGKVPHEEIAIAPFNEGQIDSYIEKFAESPYNGTKKDGTLKWDAKKYHDELANFPTLKDMMTRPFILVIGLKALPRLVENKNEQPVTLHTLYEAFTQQWLDREAGKLHGSGMDKEIIKKKIQSFCEALAFEMFLQGKYRIEKDNKKLASFLQDPNTFQSAPLKQVEPNVYEFIQKGYCYFFAAPLIIKKKVLKNHINEHVLNDALVLFLIKQMDNYQDHELEDKLWHYVAKARKEKGIGVAAACCLQLLCAMNPKSLQHKDLSGIELQGGKLAGLDLSSVNLTGANLSGQNLTQVKLPKDLSNANLTGAQLPKDLSNYNLTGANLSGQNLTQVKLPKDLSNANLTGAQLPKDLSNYNLTGANLSGQNLTQVKLPKDLSNCNLTGAQLPKDLSSMNLQGVILTNTTCDYQQAFQDNSIKNELKGGNWYQENLPKDLKSIAQVYPKLNNNTCKAKLLQVASAFSQLPFYEDTEFYIKVEYWSCELVQLKKVLCNSYGQQLICSLQSDLEWDAEDYCWTTKYPQNKVNIEGKAPHANFDTYLKEFTNGLTEYQCKSKNKKYGFDWYKEGITKNIEGLAATYPHIKEKQLQEEARDIAHALSKSYQIQQMVLLNHYLFFQNRLIQLKKSVGVGVKNKVYYRYSTYKRETVRLE